MNKSILNMNKTVGQRELESTKLSTLDEIRVRLELAATLDNEKQDAFNREMGRGIRDKALSELVDFANSDPAHVNYADPRTPAQIALEQWQQEVYDTRASDDPRGL